MANETLNDNDRSHAGQQREPDAHGEAALLLVESLIHGLIERSAISVADAVEIIDIAAEVKAALAAEPGDSPATMAKPLTLLAAIAASLRQDIARA